jgi:hypothetical protein
MEATSTINTITTINTVGIKMKGCGGSFSATPCSS